MTDLSDRVATEDIFLDAAERLLITIGYANISTRRLAEEAGLNHGLVHYYFGSMERVFIRVLERFTERLIARQRAMYAADIPFIEKWRTAMGFLDDDLHNGYQKIWYELQALSWNRPELQAIIVQVHERWRQVLREAFANALSEYSIDTQRFPLDAMTALVMTFNEGVILERLSGITTGQAELLDMVDHWLASLGRPAARGGERRDASAHT